MGRRSRWIAHSGAAVLMYLSRVASPVGLGSLSSFFSFFLFIWGGAAGRSLSVSVSLSLCRGEKWAGDHCCAPGWAIFLLWKWGGEARLLRTLPLWKGGC